MTDSGVFPLFPSRPAIDGDVMQAALLDPGALDVNAWGVRAMSQGWADALLYLATGVPDDQRPSAWASDVDGGAAVVSRAIVHNDPELTALGPQGFVDGHVLFVPLQALTERLADVGASTAWMRDGASACARVALGQPVPPGFGWAQATREQVAQALASRFVVPSDDWAHAPDQDAWRYASAVQACATVYETRSPLTGAARRTPPVPLTAGSANRAAHAWAEAWSAPSGWSSLAGRPLDASRWCARAAALVNTLDRPMAQRRLVRHLLMGRGTAADDALAMAAAMVAASPDPAHDSLAIDVVGSYLDAGIDAATAWSIEVEHVTRRLVSERWWAHGLDHGNVADRWVAMAGLMVGQRLPPRPLRDQIQNTLTRELRRCPSLGMEHLWALAEWAPWLVPPALEGTSLTVLAGVNTNRHDLWSSMLQDLSQVDAWWDAYGADAIATALTDVMRRGGASQAMRLNGSLDDSAGWDTLLVLFAHEPDAAATVFDAVARTGAELDPTFPTRLLAHLAEAYEPGSHTVKTALALGADVLALSPTPDEHGVFLPVLEVALGNPSWTPEGRRLVRAQADARPWEKGARKVVRFRGWTP